MTDVFIDRNDVYELIRRNSERCNNSIHELYDAKLLNYRDTIA